MEPTNSSADRAVPPLRVRGLSVALPDGRLLLDEIDLTIAPGEVVVLLGGSGAGKSTFARVLFEEAELTRAGYQVRAHTLELDRQTLGLVPQRGALFDHLDVRDNLLLARRRAGALGTDDAAAWLERVGLERQLAAPGTEVGKLSGGQAQRVAVARVLASQRQLLFLDEPSVGLDPHRVRMLARLLRAQVTQLGISAIVVTHDLALAGGVADRLYLLSQASRKLEPLFAESWPGPLEELDEPPPAARGADGARDADGADGAEPTAPRGRWLLALEDALVAHLREHGDRAPPRGPTPSRTLWQALARRGEPLLAPLRAAGAALAHLPQEALRHPRDVAVIVGRTLRQTLLRPLAFYAVVSTLIGYTVLLVVSKVGGAGVRPDALLRQLGGSHVVALAPAISALLFVAASGSATNAWLGSMSLTKQSLALDALGVDHRRYLLAPTWLGVALAYLVVAAVFALGMIGGGALVCQSHGIADPWGLLTGDLVDPTPERAVYAKRALFLVWVYAWGIASDVVAKGAAPKAEADAVTRAMTASVVSCTLWIVGWELVSVRAVLG